jgi:putative ABC transport system substrate-binding protein
MDVRPILAGFTAALVLVAGSPGSLAQPAAKVPRVGIVSPLAASPEPPTVRAFRRRLAELGYVEGRNVIVDARFAEGRPERFPALVDELIERKVDVLVTGSTLGAVAAKRATATVPIVFAGIFDAAASGIVTSLARPGGNITGATFGAGGSAIAGKWLELLKEAVPALAHAAVLHNSADPQSAHSLREIHGAARAMKVRVDQFDASNDATLEKAFAAIGASGAQGLIVVGTAYFGGNRVKLIRFAAEKRMPAIYFFSLFPDDGGLMSYGGSTEDSYRRAASYVDRILKGAKPADLPVDQATKYELVVNLKTAKALGIAIPRPLLLRADRLIE